MSQGVTRVLIVFARQKRWFHNKINLISFILSYIYPQILASRHCSQLTPPPRSPLPSFVSAVLIRKSDGCKRSHSIQQRRCEHLPRSSPLALYQCSDPGTRTRAILTHVHFGRRNGGGNSCPIRARRTEVHGIIFILLNVTAK